MGLQEPSIPLTAPAPDRRPVTIPDEPAPGREPEREPAAPPAPDREPEKVPA